MDRRELRRIMYRFRFGDGREKTFTARLDPVTLALADAPREPAPEWTRLDFQRCTNCPLDPARETRCPIAVRVVDVVEAFRDTPSFEQVAVVVETDLRRMRTTPPFRKA